MLTASAANGTAENGEGSQPEDDGEEESEEEEEAAEEKVTICGMMMDHLGGCHGCTLPFGHEGPHSTELEAEGGRKRRRAAVIGEAVAAAVAAGAELHDGGIAPKGKSKEIPGRTDSPATAAAAGPAAAAPAAPSAAAAAAAAPSEPAPPTLTARQQEEATVPSATERRWKLRHDGTEADDAAAANGANGTNGSNGGGSHGAAPPLLSAEDTSTALVWAANHLPGFAPAHSPCETKVDGRHRALLLGTVAAQQPNGGGGDACGEGSRAASRQSPATFATNPSLSAPDVASCAPFPSTATPTAAASFGGPTARRRSNSPPDLGSTWRTARPTATRRRRAWRAHQTGGRRCWPRSAMTTRARRSPQTPKRGGLARAALTSQRSGALPTTRCSCDTWATRRRPLCRSSSLCSLRCSAAR